MSMLAVDVENRVVTDGEFYNKDGRRFLRIKDIDVNPKIRDMIIKANGIFPDPELGMCAGCLLTKYDF